MDSQITQPRNVKLSTSLNNPPLIFSCEKCGKYLSVSLELAGISGPCPSCGTTICAPKLPQDIKSDVAPNPPPIRVRTEKSPARTRRGHISADSMLDHGHIDQRETAKNLLVITLFILVVCFCLAVSWFLDAWKTQ